MMHVIRHELFRTCSLVLVVLLFSFVVVPSMVRVQVAQAAPATPTGPQTGQNQLGVDLASPAVVRIVSAIHVTFLCPRCATDGTDISDSFDFYSGGSGAFISSDGYILTADHVVDHGINNSEDYNFAVQQVVTDLEQKYNASQSAVASFIQSNASVIQFSIQTAAQRVFLSTSYTGQLQNSAEVTGYDVTRIVANSPVDKQDTAIIKVEATDQPFLTLAPSSAIHVQDNVTAVAFPGDADVASFASLLSPTQSDVNSINSLLSPSVNTGSITAQKTLSDGTGVYETNGISSPGSSGGPVINNQGQIIGFVDAGTSTQTTTFLIPSSVAAEYARQAGIAQPVSGTFMTEWTKAITEYDAPGVCHFTNASRDLAKVQSDYPNFHAVDSLVKDAKAKATPADCPPPTNYGVIAALAVLVLLVAGGGTGFFITRSRRRQPTPVPVGVVAGNGYSAAAGYPSVPGQQPQYLAPGILPGSMPYTLPPATPAPNVVAEAYNSQPSEPIARPYAAPATPAPVQGIAAPYPTPEPTIVGQQTAVPQVVQNTPSNPQFQAAPQAQPFMSVETPRPAPAAPESLQATALYQPVPSQPAAMMLVCANGHIAHDTSAKFCPECGAPVQRVPQQPTH